MSACMYKLVFPKVVTRHLLSAPLNTRLVTHIEGSQFSVMITDVERKRNGERRRGEGVNVEVWREEEMKVERHARKNASQSAHT